MHQWRPRRLGLDRVYIQAKRYKEGNNVSSPDIRNFVGALNIHRANKGVFVTASQFTTDAKLAAHSSTVQVVLIDGERLTELMVRYKVGWLAATLSKSWNSMKALTADRRVAASAQRMDGVNNYLKHLGRNLGCQACEAIKYLIL